MQCPNCQEGVDPTAVFCGKCGARLDAQGSTPTPRGPREELLDAAEEKRGEVPPDELEIWSGSYSKLAMIDQWAMAALGTLGVLVVGVVLGVGLSAWVTLLVVVIVCWLALLAFYAYRRLSVHYRLTSQRLIHESGLLWRTIDRIELIDVSDVTFRQGPIERVFKTGTIRISSSDATTPLLALPGIDSVRQVADLIDDARRKERRRRGLHILSQTQ